MKAGLKIAETLAFTRAHGAQVKTLEKDIVLSELRVCQIMFTNASVHGWVCPSGNVSLYVAAGQVSL